jgi:hypothetical protein
MMEVRSCSQLKSTLGNLTEDSDIGPVDEAPARQGIPASSQPFTRSAVAAVLHVSLTTIRRREGTLLHPVKGTDGTHLFDPTEVQELANRRPTASPVKNSTAEGEIAAAAFAMFKKKTSARDVVIELEQSPAVVPKLQEDWERLGDRVVVGEEILGILDRMSAARLIDDEVVSAIWNNWPETIRAYVDAKLSGRQRARRPHG